MHIIKLILLSILVLTPFAPAATKVACIGNSITYGYGLNSPYYESYPSQLKNLLGNNYTVDNFGISSRTMLKRGDLPYWNESVYSNSLSSLPNVVIIKLGTNDSKLALNWTPHKAEFESDYRAMIQSYRNLSTNPTIFISQIVPAYQTIWDISDITIRQEVNPKILKVALDEGVHLIDLYQAMSNKPTLFMSDGIHPNAAGASELAKIVHKTITQTLPVIQKQNNRLSAPIGASYQWYRNSVRLDSNSGATQQTYMASVAGSYKVSVQLSDTCNTRLVSNAVTVTEADLAPTPILNDPINSRIRHDSNSESYNIMGSKVGSTTIPGFYILKNSSVYIRSHH